MGELIDLRSHFQKARQLRSVLPSIREIFLKSFPIKVRHQESLDALIQDILTDPFLPVIEFTDSVLLDLDYQLQMLAKTGSINMTSALLYARTHMEKTLNSPMQTTKAYKRFSKQLPAPDDRIARAIFGMFSIAWQISEEQELVTNAEALAKHHAKKLTPK